MIKYGKFAILIYALLMLGGGVGGYVTKKSIPSLLSGVISAGLLIAAFTMLGSQPRKGYTLAAGTAGVLVLVFIERAIRTASDSHSLMRNVGLAVLSAAFAALFATCKNGSNN